MPKKKKGKKTQKVEIITTPYCIRERERALCPRLGDAYSRTEKTNEIKMDIVIYKLRKALEKKYQDLNLNSSNLSFIPEELSLFPCASQIKELSLAKNNLFSGDHVFSALSKLFNLSFLDLSDNLLNGQLSSLISNLINLKILKLDGNQITSLPSEVGALVRLTHFSISRNQLVALPDEIENWQSIEYANFRDNKIVTLPEKIVNWKKLKIFYIGTNLLTLLPEDIGNLTELVQFEARRNMIDFIPDSLKFCTNLQILNLGENKITTIPTGLFSCLVNIKELYLYKNKIAEVPPDIGQLVECVRLSLSSNIFKSIPSDIAYLTNLEELYISNCAKFSNFPSSSSKLSRLAQISMRKNPALKILPVGGQDAVSAPCKWENLKLLDVQAAKKQVCKLDADMVAYLTAKKCIIRGGVCKKAKGKKK